MTGEVSMRMIKDAGAQLVEIGHSERREFFGENDQDVARKVRAAVDQGITPLICVGESQAVRSAGDHVTFVRNQVGQALSLIDPTEHGHRHHNSRELTAGENQQPPRRETRGIRKSVPIRDQHSTQIAEINGNPRE